MPTVSARIDALRIYYAEYLETLRPRERYLRPSVESLILEPEMQKILEGPDEEGVDEAQRMKQIMDEGIEHYVDLYRQERDKELCETLKQRSLPVGDGVLFPLELATAVFLCHRPEDVIAGLRNHNSHNECTSATSFHLKSADMFIRGPHRRVFGHRIELCCTSGAVGGA